MRSKKQKKEKKKNRKSFTDIGLGNEQYQGDGEGEGVVGRRRERNQLFFQPQIRGQFEKKKKCNL